MTTQLQLINIIIIIIINKFQKRKFAALIVDPEAYERISGLCLQTRVLALTGMRVVTQDFGRKSKLKFWS